MTCSQPLRSQNIAPFLNSFHVRIAVLNERDVCGPVWVVLDPDDVVWAGFFADKVYKTDSTPVTPSAVPNGDLAGVVSPALFAQRDSKLADGPAFPEMGVQGATKVSDAGGDGLVSFEEGRSPGEGFSNGCGRVEGDFGSVTSKPERCGRQYRRFLRPQA